MPNFVLMSTSSSADITTFTGWATELVSWIVTTMTTFLNFMLSNPIALVSLVLALIVTAVGMLRHIIGG